MYYTLSIPEKYKNDYCFNIKENKEKDKNKTNNINKSFSNDQLKKLKVKEL
jgi:hypothetical protein